MSVTRTTTITTPTLPPLTRRLRGHLTAEAFVARFLEIFEKYVDAEDPLSLSLTAWSAEVSEILLTNRVDFLTVIAEKVHTLRHIIINPLDLAPLEHPRVAGGRLWEAWMLEHVRELFEDISPYSDEASLADAAPHPFADDLLRLLDAVFASKEMELIPLQQRLKALREKEEQDRLEALRKGEDCPIYLTQEAAAAYRPAAAMREYMGLARNAERLEELTSLTAYIKESTKALTITLEATEARVREHVAATRAALEAGEIRLERDLAEIRSTYGEIITSLRTSLDRAQTDNEHLETRVREAEWRVASAEERIRSLEGRLAAAEAQNAANWQAANSGGGDGGCTIM